MSKRLAILGAAAALAAIDLAQKASEPVYGHPRSTGYEVLAAAIAALLVALVPRVPSRALACACAVAVFALRNPHVLREPA
jgi:hypothetical protein